VPPPARTDRPRADDSRTVEAILYVLRVGCAWADLPAELGDDATAHRRLYRWQADGVWKRTRWALLAELDTAISVDWSAGLLDGSITPAKGGGIGVGLTGKGKGIRLMLATDAVGAPLGLLSTGANVAEVRVAEATLVTIPVPRHRGRSYTRPDQLVADRGYDGRPLRRRLRARGIRACNPPKRRPASWKPAHGRPLSPSTLSDGPSSAPSRGSGTSVGCWFGTSGCPRSTALSSLSPVPSSSSRASSANPATPMRPVAASVARYRSDRKNARIASATSAGSSRATKCHPRGS
jgi:hypothetical protein